MLAKETNSAVFFSEYPLAPEKRFPCAINNLLATYRYLLEVKKIDPKVKNKIKIKIKIKKNLKNKQIFFAGDSAGNLNTSDLLFIIYFIIFFVIGGGLVFSLTESIIAKGIEKPAGLIVYSPYINLDTNERKTTTMDYLINTVVLKYCSELYLGEASASLSKCPLATPCLSQNLKDYPPTQIFSTSEFLEFDSHNMFERLKESGVSVDHFHWPHLIHVWTLFAPGSSESVKSRKISKNWMDKLKVGSSNHDHSN